MTTSHLHEAHQAQELFGRRIADHLSVGTLSLPHETCERLRAARVRAVSQRRVEALQPERAFASAHGAQLSSPWSGPNLWSRLASALPMLLLAGGLVTINLIQDELRASELAEVDTALLIDDLPPAAYADAGFAQYLKSER